MQINANPQHVPKLDDAILDQICSNRKGHPAFCEKREGKGIPRNNGGGYLVPT